MPRQLDSAVFRLALSNLRRKKNSPFSFALIILLAVALLDAGLMLLFYLPRLYDDSNDRLSGPHYTLRVPNNYYKEEYSLFFEGDPRVSLTETEDAIMEDNASYRLAKGSMLLLPNFFDAGREREILPLTLTGPTADIPPDESVYVPMMLKQQGFAVGDPIEFTLRKQPYTYRIAGFLESTWNATMTSNMLSFYLGGEAYQKLYDEIGGGKMISVRLHDPADLDALIHDFQSQTGIVIDAPGFKTQINGIGIDVMRQASTMITGVLSALFAAFSLIVLAIALLVIRFRISNYIQDHMQSIGALEAIGYTSGQVRCALTLECALSGLAGAAAGILSCYGLLSLLGRLISSSLGVRWLTLPHPGYDLCSLAVILGAVCLTALLATRKIRRLAPVTALRSGLRTHSFRRNILPLDARTGPLNLSLSCKAVAANLRQYVMLAVILCGVTFSSVFAVLMFTNLAVDASSFVDLMGEEMSDALVTMTGHTDAREVKSLLAKQDGVRKSVLYDSSSVTIEEELVNLVICEDYSQLETASVFKGSFPQYENEAVITGVLADKLGKTVGDTLTLKRSGVEADYIICGLSQTLSNFGRRCMTTIQGFRRLEPDYHASTLNVYLEPGMDSAAFIQRIEKEPYVLNPSVAAEDLSLEANARRKAENKIQNMMAMYGMDSAQYALMDGDAIIFSGDTSQYLVDTIVDQRSLMESSVGMYSVFIGALATGILILTILVVAMILHLVVHATILRQKQQFGIQKALGFTSAQLRLQIALCFLPVSLPGVAAGILLGSLFTGPLLTALMRTMGISKLSIVSHPVVLAALGCLMLLFTFTAAMAAARPVKKISVYELFTE